MQIEAAFSLSEEYYKFMSDFAQTSFEDDKLLGKFYTDFTVAKRMVETIVENVKLDVFSRDIKLIDPFCGDGRLISETIIQLSIMAMFRLSRIILLNFKADSLS